MSLSRRRANRPRTTSRRGGGGAPRCCRCRRRRTSSTRRCAPPLEPPLEPPELPPELLEPPPPLEPPPRGTACWLAAGSGAARLAVTASVQIRCFIRFSASPVLTRLQVARSARGGCNTLATRRVYDNVGNAARFRGNVLAAVLPNGSSMQLAAGLNACGRFAGAASIDRLRRRGQRLPADVEDPCRRAPRDRRRAPGPRRVRQEGAAARPAAGGAGACRGPDGRQDRRGGPGALHRAVDQRRPDQTGRPGRGRGVRHFGQARGSARQFAGRSAVHPVRRAGRPGPGGAARDPWRGAAGPDPRLGRRAGPRRGGDRRPAGPAGPGLVGHRRRAPDAGRLHAVRPSRSARHAPDAAGHDRARAPARSGSSRRAVLAHLRRHRREPARHPVGDLEPCRRAAGRCAGPAVRGDGRPRRNQRDGRVDRAARHVPSCAAAGRTGRNRGALAGAERHPHDL